VTAVDTSSGKVDTTYIGGVVLSLASNPNGGTLGGTTSAVVLNGAATFTGLTLDKAGSGYTLQATSGNLVATSNQTLDVIAGAAAQLVVTSQPPATVTAGQTFGITVTVADQYGNPVTDFSGNVAVRRRTPRPRAHSAARSRCPSQWGLTCN
jgi:mannose/cellobiose epimerase-like protein (N-acyl-D-glucosamine 2-epimerase family)